MLLFPAFWRMRQEECEFQAILGCIMTPCLKTKRKERKGKKNIRVRFPREKMGFWYVHFSIH
jgi:hypothetical protein